MILLGAAHPANAAVLLNARFDQNVPDNSPVGAAPGWHAIALHNGAVTDYTTSTPNGNYPTISHSTAGAGNGGVGYLVFGAGNLVSNVCIWLDTPSLFQGKSISSISFYSRNNASASTERIILRIGNQWYASAQTLNDSGNGSSWTLNEFGFDSGAASWRLFNTNTLTVGAPLASPLPAETITGIGFFGFIQQDSGKIRVDEVVVTGFVTNAPPEILAVNAQPATNVYAGTTLVLNVSADGAPSLNYQWRRNGTNLLNAPGISGATSSSLTLSNATPADSGVYHVVVSNAHGTNTSAPVPISVNVATPAIVDWSEFNANGAIAVASQETNTLTVSWTNRSGNAFRVRFNLMPGQVLLRSVETAGGPGAAFTTIAQDVDVRYRVTLGSRFEKAGWPYIFFDRVDANSPAPIPHLSSLDPKKVRVVSDSPHRARLIFSGLQIGPYVGEMTCVIYDGSPFVQFQASMEVTRPWAAYLYDALFYADFANISYRDSHGTFQMTPAHSLSQTLPGEAARVLAKHRTIMGTVAGGTGTLAVMSPPHAAIYPIDQSDNYGFLQAGKKFIGTKMSYSADNRYRPWVDAPNGSTQRMDVFLVLGAGTPQATLTTVLDYTHGDFFKPLAGHYTMAEHFHPEFTANYRSGRDTVTPFKEAMQSIGVRIVQPMEFHGPGSPFNNMTNRLAELHDMFNIMAAHSDENFLFIPGEEYNNWFGGHWSYMFTRPVYFTGWPGQGTRPFKMTNLVAGTRTYPLVYQVGDADHMSQLLQEEGGLAWTSHPRIKGSRQNPDIFANTAFFKDDSFLAGDWKSMPLDLSKDRLGFRSFQLMDDVAQWGYRKSMLGEVDTFLLDATHEIYAHMNVNYLQLQEFPSKTNWASVVECVRNGEFFTTTGELLIHRWNATSAGVTATVEWYFPPAFAEITWGDDNGIRKLKRALTNGIEFETCELVMPADLSAANWVRFEVWDVARNGAFTQQRWLKAPAKPETITGATTSFTLIDSDTDAPVPGFDPIQPNAVLNKAALPPNLTIRANVSPLLMDSVVVDMNGVAVTRTQWPYSLAPCASGPGIGDSAAYNYAATVFNLGNHVITATPYRGAVAGKSLTLHFSVVHSNAPATSFNMDGKLDSHGYQVAPDGKLFAAIRGTVLYVAAPASGAADQFIFVTDQPGGLLPAPRSKAGLVAIDINTVPFLTHDSTSGLIAWDNGGTNAFAPEQASNAYMEGQLNLATAFGAVPPLIYIALAGYAPHEGGALLPGSQIASGNGDGNIDSTEFLSVPSATIRDDQLNGVLDVLEPGLSFTASFDTNPGMFIVRWPSVPGYTYQVYAANEIAQSFAPISGPLVANPGTFSMSYTDLPPATISRRFYRASRLVSSATPLSRFQFNGDFTDAGPASLAASATDVAFTTDCKEGDSAVEFNGVSSVIQTGGPNPVSGSFSVAFWLKTMGTNPGNPGDQWFLGAGLVDADTPGVNTDWGIAMTGSCVAFGIGGGSVGANATITSSPVADGHWNHVVASWNADTREMNLYLNGESNVAGMSASGEARVGAAEIVVGRCATASRFLRGLLDDIQIFDRVLTFRDISLLAHASGLSHP